MVGEEEQIASELANILVQRLFKAGLDLKTALKSTSDPKARQSIEAALKTLNDSINTIRRAAWSLPPDEGNTRLI